MATDFNPPQNPPGSPVPKKKIRREDALAYHSMGRKGKIEVVPTKPCATARDLSLAYTPGRRRAVPRDREGPGPLVPLHGARQPRRRRLERHRRARPRRHRPRRRQAGDGGQGRPLQAVRRHRRLRHQHRREGDRQGLHRREGARADVRRASTSRTSRPPSASSSRSGSRRRCRSRSSTTTSTGPRSSPAPRCSTRSSSPARRSTKVKVVVSGAGARRDRLHQVLPARSACSARTS